MKRTFKKSTNAEIRVVVQMYKEDKSIAEIERVTGRDRTTVYWWLKKLDVYKNKPKILFVENLLKEVDSELVDIPKDNIKPIRPVNSCLICWGKKKDKWKTTDYCSLKCWDKNKVHKINPIYYY